MRPAPLLAALLLLPAALVAVPMAVAANCGASSTGLVPLTDMGAATWNGFPGGLYPGGNARPALHTQLGEALASAVVPRSLAGTPDPLLGKIVFLSVGMSNTRAEFQPFVAMSNADPLKHPRVQAVNGAIGGMPASAMNDLTDPYWTQLLNLLLAAQASPLQVQAVWLKQANAGPSGSAPAYAQNLQDDLRSIVQNLKVLFPNLMLVYLSSRIYAGYASTGLNPEPYAYASGFSVKWLIEDQLASPLTFASLTEPTEGVLLPWLSWGPYLWADGLARRSDGLTWACAELAADGTHPSGAGSQKVAQMLMAFVHGDPTARIWYEQGGALPG